MPVSGSACVFVLRAFDEGDFFRRKVVEFIDELIDLPVDPGAFVFEVSAVAVGLGGGNLRLRFQHRFHQLHKPIVLRFLRGVGEVEGAKWKPFHKLRPELVVAIVLAFQARTDRREKEMSNAGIQDAEGKQGIGRQYERFVVDQIAFRIEAEPRFWGDDWIDDLGTRQVRQETDSRLLKFIPRLVRRSIFDSTLASATI